jgi:hypothetical protein
MAASIVFRGSIRCKVSEPHVSLTNRRVIRSLQTLVLSWRADVHFSSGAIKKRSSPVENLSRSLSLDRPPGSKDVLNLLDKKVEELLGVDSTR